MALSPATMLHLRAQFLATWSKLLLGAQARVNPPEPATDSESTQCWWIRAHANRVFWWDELREVVGLYNALVRGNVEHQCSAEFVEAIAPLTSNGVYGIHWTLRDPDELELIHERVVGGEVPSTDYREGYDYIQRCVRAVIPGAADAHPRLRRILLRIQLGGDSGWTRTMWHEILQFVLKIASKQLELTSDDEGDDISTYCRFEAVEIDARCGFNSIIDEHALGLLCSIAKTGVHVMDLPLVLLSASVKSCRRITESIFFQLEVFQRHPVAFGSSSFLMKRRKPYVYSV